MSSREDVRRRLDQLRAWRKPRGFDATRQAIDGELKEIASAKGMDGILEAVNGAVPGMEFEIVGIVHRRLIIKAPDSGAAFLLDGALRSGLERQLLSLSRGAFGRVKVQQ